MVLGQVWWVQTLRRRSVCRARLSLIHEWVGNWGGRREELTGHPFSRDLLSRSYKDLWQSDKIFFLNMYNILLFYLELNEGASVFLLAFIMSTRSISIPNSTIYSSNGITLANVAVGISASIAHTNLISAQLGTPLLSSRAYLFS